MNTYRVSLLFHSAFEERDRAIKELRVEDGITLVKEIERYTKDPILGISEYCTDAVDIDIISEMTEEEVSVAIENVSCRMSDVLMYFSLD